MALNSSQKAFVDNRRREIARLRLRGLSQREIMAELEKTGIVNPETGKPYALGTINADLQGLHADWKQQAMEDTRSQRGRVLAEGREVRRKAWENEDFGIVQRGLAQETALLGLQRPAAPEDLIHYDTRYIEIESEMSKYVAKLITAGHAPNVTAEEKAILKEKFVDWFNYANMLLERSEAGLEPLADSHEPNEEELEHPADDDAQDEDDEQGVS